MREQRFRDRTEAGQTLATMLTAYVNRSDVLVLALPRGGVAVGYEVARALHVPLDVLVVRKLGVPGEEELAIGAIATGNIRILNDDVVRFLKGDRASYPAMPEGYFASDLKARLKAWEDEMDASPITFIVR